MNDAAVLAYLLKAWLIYAGICWAALGIFWWRCAEHTTGHPLERRVGQMRNEPDESQEGATHG